MSTALGSAQTRQGPRPWASVLGGLVLLLTAAAGPRREAFGPPVPPPPPTPYDLCELAIAEVQAPPIPPTLLAAIARVESGRLDPATNRVRPWPWAINVEGRGFFYDNKDEAVAAVQAIQARGQRSVDVGCMQVNLMHHPAAFPDLVTAFDPRANAAYAQRFLLSLHAATKDWPLATAWYHSATQEFGEDYQRRVFGRVLTPMGPPRPPPAPANPYAALPPASAQFGAFLPQATQFGAFAGAASAAPPAARPRR